MQGTVVLCKMLNSNHCELNELLLSRCKLTSTESCLPKTDHMNLDNNVSGDTVREIGQQLCQLPSNNIVTIIDLDGNSLTGDGVHILLGLLHLCVRLRSLSTCNCGITSVDLIQLFDHLKSSPPSSYCRASLGEWNLDRNKIDDGGVLTLIEQLTSLFPNFNQTFSYICLSGNPASSEMTEKLKQELKRQEVEFFLAKNNSYFTFVQI